MEFCDLKKQYEHLRTDIDSSISHVLIHGKFVGGPEILELENKLAEYVGVKNAIAVSSGTDALILSLMALGIGNGDYVITVPFTFVANVESVILNGAIPLFVDVNKDDFTIDINKLNELIKNPIDPNSGNPIEKNKIKAIIAVDLFGHIVDYNKINELIADKDIYLIEDAAQSFGSELLNRKACSFGDISITSFFPAKPFGCYGDGGMIFTDSNLISKRLMMLRDHGQEEKYTHKIIGTNSRMDTIQAAILLAKFNEFKSNEIKNRRKVVSCYIKNLKILEENGFIKLPIFDETNKSVYAQFSILINNRDRFLEFLKINLIPFAIHYPVPLHLQPAFSYLGYKKGDFPVSEELSKKIVSIPLDAYKTNDEINNVCDIIKRFFKS